MLFLLFLWVLCLCFIGCKSVCVSEISGSLVPRPCVRLLLAVRNSHRRPGPFYHVMCE